MEISKLNFGAEFNSMFKILFNDPKYNSNIDKCTVTTTSNPTKKRGQPESTAKLESSEREKSGGMSLNELNLLKN